MELNDIFDEEGVDPNTTIVFRHRPREAKLRKVLTSLVDERPDLFNAYQQTQPPRVEKAMLRAKHVASFIGLEPGKAVYVATYKFGGHRSLNYARYWKEPLLSELKRDIGMVGMTDNRGTALWFNLVPHPIREEWKGKLIIHWPGKEVSWWRWANKNKFAIHAIAEDSIFAEEMPPWNELVLTSAEIRALRRKWREELQRWRAIYFILDETDGKGYVGAAYGAENVYGRWLSYVKSGHGGNKRLRGRDGSRFRFSLLEILPHNLDERKVCEIETSWKKRLHTREFGLNYN